MTSNPKFISENTTASKALSIMNERRISTLLVATDKELKKKGNKKVTGKRKKLDMDKDGKLTKKDFAMLRSKKKGKK